MPCTPASPGSPGGGGLDVQAQGDDAEVEDACGDVDVVRTIAQRDGIGAEGTGDGWGLDLNSLDLGARRPSHLGTILLLQIRRAVRAGLQRAAQGGALAA